MFKDVTNWSFCTGKNILRKRGFYNLLFSLQLLLQCISQLGVFIAIACKAVFISSVTNSATEDKALD